MEVGRKIMRELLGRSFLRKSGMGYIATFDKLEEELRKMLEIHNLQMTTDDVSFLIAVLVLFKSKAVLAFRVWVLEAVTDAFTMGPFAKGQSIHRGVNEFENGLTFKMGLRNANDRRLKGLFL